MRKVSKSIELESSTNEMMDRCDLSCAPSRILTNSVDNVLNMFDINFISKSESQSILSLLIRSLQKCADRDQFAVISLRMACTIARWGGSLWVRGTPRIAEHCHIHTHVRGEVTAYNFTSIIMRHYYSRG